MLGKREDLTGLRFGRLEVLEFHSLAGNGKACWICRCDCGSEKVVRSNHMKSGATKSCGCLDQERKLKHGMYGTPTYSSWRGMKERCLNKKTTQYKDYGGRGITVCKRWLKFENFFNDMGVRPEGMSIDRIDNNKGYCKENCR